MCHLWHYLNKKIDAGIICLQDTCHDYVKPILAELQNISIAVSHLVTIVSVPYFSERTFNFVQCAIFGAPCPVIVSVWIITILSYVQCATIRIPYIPFIEHSHKPNYTRLSYWSLETKQFLVWRMNWKLWTFVGTGKTCFCKVWLNL